MIFPDGEKCYLGHGNYQLSYLLKCDPNIELSFETVWKLGQCQMEYSFLTKYACVHFSIQSSFSIFSINGGSKDIVATILIVLSIYISVFTYINYRNNPEDGFIKALPHRSFWGTIFDNSQYGLEISLNFCKAKIFGSNENREYL